MPLIINPSLYERRDAVYKLLEAFSEIWPESRFGPLHILIDDQNALDDDLASCKGRVRGMLKEGATQAEIDSVKDYDLHNENELRASLLFLDMLALIPEDWRDIHAEGVEDDA